MKLSIKDAQNLYANQKYCQAASAFDELAAQRQVVGDRVGEAEMRNNQSVALLMSGDAYGAYQAAKGTDAVFADIGDLKRQAISLGNQAAALERLDDVKKALALYQKGAQILKDTNETETRQILLESLSSLQLRNGQQFEALAAAQAALDLKKKKTIREKALSKLLEIPFHRFKA